MSRWSDDSFLDSLMRQGDALADATVAALVASSGIDAVNRSFAYLQANDDPIPEDAPVSFRLFCKQTMHLPEGVDMQRIDRGEQALMSYILESGVMMLCRSLPEGYASPRLSQVLCISNDLGNATYNRVLGVVQMLINIGTKHGFEEEGYAIITAQKMRLMHAGARRVAHQYLPNFKARLGGEPISLEDMLGTLMGFSLLAIDGLETLDIGLSPEQAEDIYYLWQVMGVMLGIHPPVEAGQSATFEYIPEDLTSAREFYRSYARRHYVNADENPEGCYLAAADLHMMVQLMHPVLRFISLGLIPRLIMQDVMGEEAMRRVKLKPVPLYPLLKGVFLDLPLRLDKMLHSSKRSPTGHFAAHILEDMVVWKYGQPVGFDIPTDLSTLEALSLNKAKPCLEHGAYADLTEIRERRRAAKSQM
jgi:hypothetical protein